MKVSGTLVASFIAASTVALTSSSSSSSAGNRVSFSSSSNQGRQIQPKTTSEKDKFAPRLDGLKFIETLVTAHR